MNIDTDFRDCNPARCANGKCSMTAACIDQLPPANAVAIGKLCFVHCGDRCDCGALQTLFGSPPLAPAAPRTIIAFTGLAGSGKSTAAAHLVNRYGYTRVRFAGPLKAMLAALGCTPDEIDGHLKETPCDLLCGKTPRQAMQWLGTEFGRQLIGDDLWIRAWQTALARTPGNVVIDDCRFPNEATAIQAAGGVLIRIERPGAGTASVHASEQHTLPSVATIHNTTTAKGLLYAVDELVTDLSWRDIPEAVA